MTTGSLALSGFYLRLNNSLLRNVFNDLRLITDSGNLYQS